jgi:2',3'-cyclic-nucleotide 2'-phosphodiesterase
LKILFIGDIVGKPGRRAVSEILPNLKKERQIDFCIANGENLAGGRGINIKSAEQLYRTGVDAITLGNHIFDHCEAFNLLLEDDRIVRAANLPPDTHGSLYQTFNLNGNPPLVVFQLDGRVFMKGTDCPFRTMDRMLKKLTPEQRRGIILVDFHAEATSEKIALGWYLDGRVSALVGTHTHIPTADERVLPGGTAYITDVGMTGPYDSVIGVVKETIIHKFIHGHGPYNEVAKNDIRFTAVLIETEANGRMAKSIERIQIPIDTGAGGG